MTVISTLTDRILQGVSLPLRRFDEIAERVLDGDLIVYDLKHQRVHILNPTAAFIWQRCDGQHALEDIVADLAQHFSENDAVIHADVLPILQSYAAEGLLET